MVLQHSLRQTKGLQSLLGWWWINNEGLDLGFYKRLICGQL